MKPSLQKLQRVFKLEADRGYDNRAVVGGIDRMLEHWTPEARHEGVPEDLIAYIESRFRDYNRLSEKSRAEALQGMWRRIQRSEESDLSSQPVEIEDHKEALPVSPPEPEPAGAPEITSDEAPPEATDSTIQAEAAPSIIAAPPEKAQTTEQAAHAAVIERFERKQREIQPTVEPAALNAPVTVLQGIGPRIAQNLSRLGLHTLRDMLYHFPRRYDDYSRLAPINRLQYGDKVTVIATVQQIKTRLIRNGTATLVEALVSDGSGALRVSWFNQVWRAKRLYEGSQIVLAGKVDQYLGRKVMTNPDVETLEEEQLSTNRIVPVYPLTEQVTQSWLRKQMNQVVSYWAPRTLDPLPEKMRREAELIPLPDALLQIHFPESHEALQAAQERLAFDEIFLLQSGVVRQKHAWQNRTAKTFTAEPEWLDEQVSRLPYQLTGAQQHALDDIKHDLASGKPMNRLIQGDVGSGQTVIAALAIAIVTSQGSQACMMAPTSLLAEQHYQTLLNLLTKEPPSADAGETPGAPILTENQVRLLIGSTPEAEKQEIRAGLADGAIKLVVGTHALIEDPVGFANLSLVIVDEQHRFGVDQRAALRLKGVNPHLMVMTATPIPRSLALTIYGDLDLTVMDEMPPGRQPVGTFILMPRERERAYSLIRSQIEQGRQTFIIYPLIEESENSEARAAVEEQKRLQSTIFPHLQVGLLHGRMRSEDKEAVMEAFRRGEFPILVSTTVIEVGVDIPNASVMLIEGANRFGLAQLHQLRGRVGRGADKSYCLLIPESQDEAENERLLVMTSTNDGFVLAERDLEQRGPGDFLGSRQSGFAELKMAKISDIHLIEKARRFAQALFETDPALTLPEHQLLASSLQQFWEENVGDIS